MTKEPSAGERIADLVGGGKFETVTGLAHAIDAAIRDSNAELVGALEGLLHHSIKRTSTDYCVYYEMRAVDEQIAREALARHSADKGEV